MLVTQPGNTGGGLITTGGRKHRAAAACCLDRCRKQGAVLKQKLVVGPGQFSLMRRLGWVGSNRGDLGAREARLLPWCGVVDLRQRSLRRQALWLLGHYIVKVSAAAAQG